MTTTTRNDPFGPSYWSLTDAQRTILGALTDDYLPLRQVFENAERNALSSHGRTNWEKLAVMGALEVDTSRRDRVWVRRGPSWSEIWEQYGIQTTTDEMGLQELSSTIASAICESNK